MSPIKPRPGTHGDHDRHARRTPAGGVSTDFVSEEPTPPPIDAPPAPRTATVDRIDIEMRELRQRHNELAEATWSVRHLPETIAKVDRTVEKIDGRLDGLAERVVRAEDKGEAAWNHSKEIMPKLDIILGKLGDVGRLAEGVDKANASIEAQNERLTAVETEQQLAAQRFEAHDQRDKEIEATVGRIERDVAALQTARAIEDQTARIQKRIAKARSWWFSAKGVSTVIAAIAAAAVAITAAIYR